MSINAVMDERSYRNFLDEDDALPRRGPLPPVGLEALNAEAALQTRIDTKYLITAEEAEEIPTFLPDGSAVLEINGKRQFAYHSVYFDTPEMDSYFGSAHRHRRRFKVRTRAYLDSDIAFLEIKIRGARGVTEKHRIPHSVEELTELRGFDREFAASQLESGRIDPTLAYQLRPQLATGYQRATYLVPGRLGPSRVTVDTGLYWEELAGDPLGEHPMLFRPGLAIVETKSQHFGSEVDRLLWRRGIRSQSVSKYCTGAAALDRRLPANKWHRALEALVAPEETL